MSSSNPNFLPLTTSTIDYDPVSPPKNARNAWFYALFISALFLATLASCCRTLPNWLMLREPLSDLDRAYGLLDRYPLVGWYLNAFC